MITYYGHAGMTNNLCEGILKNVCKQVEEQWQLWEAKPLGDYVMTLKVDGRLINRFQK
jgi:hypothetical protein